jgi:hypothetical protein
MSSQQEITDLELHASAQAQVQNYRTRFTKTLIQQAKLLAYHHGDDLVLSTHVEQARRMIMQRPQKESWAIDLLMGFGGIFIGASVSGFPSEMSKQPINGTLVTFYVVMGTLGLLMFVIPLMLKHRTTS